MNHSVLSGGHLSKSLFFLGTLFTVLLGKDLFAECTPPPTGLVGWWPGNGSANDIAGTNHGTFVAANYSAGKVDQAFNFNVTTNVAYVLIPASSTLDVGTGAGLTIEAWINPADLTTSGPIAEWALNGGYAVHFYANTLSSGRLYANLVGAAGDEHTIETPTAVLSANTYQHVALTYDKASGVARLFRNGVIVQESNLGNIGTLRTSSDLYIGHRPITSPGGGFTFRGQIDEFSLYGRALSASEIHSIFLADNAGKCTTTNPLCATPPTGLVSWFAGNGNAGDLVGTNNGTFVNASYASGKVGQAFYFDGSGNHVRVPASPTLDLGMGAGLTIEAWINPADLTTQGPIAEWALNDAYAVHFYANAPFGDGRLYADLVSASSGDHVIQTASSVLSSNTYQHVALTYDKASGLARLFRNGVIVQESNLGTIAALRTSSDLYIGYRPITSPAGGLSFRGRIDEVSLYNRALTTGEIQSIYIADSAGKCMPANPPGCRPPPAGLVSWYTGNWNASDLAGTNNGIYLNPSFGSGKVGQAFNFDGSGNHVRIPASASLDVGLGNGLTVEAWVNPTDVAASRPIVEWAVNNDYGVHLFVGNPNPGQIYVSVFGTDGNPHVILSAGSVMQVNTFQHVAFTYDKASGVGRVYRNGVVVGESDLGQFTPRTSSDLYIGYRPTGSPFGPIPFLGQVDEVSIYSRALAASEVEAIYMAGESGKCGPGPLPIILAQPVSLSVAVGGTATFSVTASSGSPLTYQWRLEGTNLSGATSSSLVLSNVQLTDAGTYSVAVSNSAGELVSSNAVLTVNLPPPCATPPAGLVSWWPGNGDANDMVSGNTGTFVGASFAAGKVSQAFSFDGSGNHVRIPASASLDVGLGNGLTVEAWVNPSDAATSRPIVEWAVNGNYAVHLFTGTPSPGQIYASIFGTDNGAHVVQSSGSVIQANTFQHIAVTYDKASGLGRVYRNGVIVGESNLGQFTPRTSSDVYIGYRPASSPYGPVSFLGQIDEVSIYSRALAPAELQAIYNAGSSGKCVVPTAPFIFSQPGDQLVAEGGNATFSVAAGGTPPLSYQWSLNGAPVADATNASLSLTGVTTNQAGAYSVLVTNLQGSVLSSNATLTVRVMGPNLFDDFDPEIDTMQWAGFGGTVRATNYGGFVSASNSLWFGGSGSRFATTRPLNTSQGAGIQFYLRLANGSPPLWDRPELPNDGVVLESSTNSGINWTQLGRYDTTNYTNWTSVSLVIPPGAQAPNTQFRWRQLANSGSSSDHWALDDVAIITGPVLPFITSHPQNQTATVGDTASFNVVAGGTLPLSYQWWFNQTNVIAGATTSSLVLTNVQLTGAGTYSVVVSNAAGSVTSSNAFLTVNLPPANVAVTSLSAESAAAVSLPLVLTANGNENAVGFSLNFDPAKLSYTGVTLGSGASAATLLVNTNELGTGKLGIALALPTDAVFASGANEIALVGFSTAMVTSPAVTPVNFGDVPIARLVSGTLGNALSSVFTGGTVSIAAANYEGDIAPRPDGDRSVVITDWVLEGRYAARLDYPTNAIEFQRADCAPRATLGDGLITVTDWVQAGRYAAALDPLTVVGGPSSEGGGAVGANGSVHAAGGDREVSVTNGMLLPSQTATVGVQLKAQGDENALGFSLSFDPTKLTYAGTMLGSGAGGATLNVNASQAATGKLGIVMALGTGSSFAAGTHEVVKLNFTAATTVTCEAEIALADQPVPRQVSDPLASALPASYVSGTIAVNPLPVLGIGRVNENILLSWPEWGSNYVLQTSASLSSGGWTNLGASASPLNGQLVVTQALGTEAIFFRLKQ